MRTRRHRQSKIRPSWGFTLIEVLAATFVTTVGLISTFYLVGVGTSVNTDAKATAQAYQAAQQEIEIIRNMPYNPTGNFCGLIALNRPAPSGSNPESRFLQSDGSDDASRPGDTGFANGVSYPGLVSALASLPNGRGGVIITDATPDHLCKNVTVVVRWTDKGGTERNVAVGTMVSNGGIDPR